MKKLIAHAAFVVVCIVLGYTLGSGIMRNHGQDPHNQPAELRPSGAAVASGLKYDRALTLAQSYWRQRGERGKCSGGAKFYLMPSQAAEGHAYPGCAIGLNNVFAGRAPWYTFCFVVIHEWGHLQGRKHQADGTVMGANPEQPQECLNPSDTVQYPGSMLG